MFKLLKSLLKPKSASFVLRQVRDSDRYGREKREARSNDVTARMKLAINPRTHQEILYYMAEHDTNPAVRQAVARNASTPIQATAMIADDHNQDVRLALAERLVRLLPELSRDEHVQLYAIAVQSLGALAMDEVLKIRIALSSALKDHAYAPPAVVSKLARDVERAVAEPILRFCAALPDDVLLDVIQNSKHSWAVQAIASRGRVSEPVSIAVIDRGDGPAGKILLENPGACIGVELLRDIVARAKSMPEWQEPLAKRKNLPPHIAKALAEFAHDSVQTILMNQTAIDARTTQQVTSIFKRRIAYSHASEAVQEETPYDRAVRLLREGQLTEQIVADALGIREEEFVVAAIACMARTSIPAVKRIFSLQAAKPIVALSWRAGLSMRMALRLQQDLGRVPIRELIYPRDGTDYPLSEAELLWQLDFLGLKAA